MKKTLWIGFICVLAIACSDKAAKNAQQSGADNQMTAQGGTTLIGCLARADESSGSVGTSGSAPPPANDASSSAPAADRFVLRQASPSASGSAGVGTSGSTLFYALDGDTADLRNHLGQKVEVNGRLEVTPPAGTQRLFVTSIRTVADTCANP